MLYVRSNVVLEEGEAVKQMSKVFGKRRISILGF